MNIQISVHGGVMGSAYIDLDSDLTTMMLQLPPDSYQGKGVDSDSKHYLTFKATDSFLDELSSAIAMVRKIRNQ